MIDWDLVLDRVDAATHALGMDPAEWAAWIVVFIAILLMMEMPQ